MNRMSACNMDSFGNVGIIQHLQVHRYPQAGDEPFGMIYQPVQPTTLPADLYKHQAHPAIGRRVLPAKKGITP